MSKLTTTIDEIIEAVKEKAAERNEWRKEDNVSFALSIENQEFKLHLDNKRSGNYLDFAGNIKELNISPESAEVTALSEETIDFKKIISEQQSEIEILKYENEQLHGVREENERLKTLINSPELHEHRANQSKQLEALSASHKELLKLIKHNKDQIYLNDTDWKIITNAEKLLPPKN